MKSSTKKFIVIFSIALIISLGIPHFSLWNFSVGITPVKAETCSLTPIPTGTLTRTLHYTNPLEKKDVPGRCTPEYNGDPSSGTINANIDYKLIQAGSSVTIKGSVAKLCSTCNGYVYTCQSFEEHTCDKNNGFATGILWDRCTYKDCPPDMPTQLHAEGKDTKWKIGRIIGTVLIIASLVFGGGWAATVLKVVEKGITEAAAKKLVITIGIGLLTTGGTKSKGNPMSFDVSGTEEEFSACPDCYTICGTTYETSAGQLPRCDKGLGTATVVIDYKNQTYSCREGYCGMWENKKVKIELLNPSGTKVATDYTTTDGSGQFSYTFAAPSGDGEFTAIVSVPKDW